MVAASATCNVPWTMAISLRMETIPTTNGFALIIVSVKTKMPVKCDLQTSRLLGARKTVG